MSITYSFKLCNNLKKIYSEKAISEDKNTLYICKAGTNKKENLKERWMVNTKNKRLKQIS